MNRAIVLIAHGSRDALWRSPIEAVRARTQALLPHCVVRCAYLELCPPDVAQTVAELAAAAVTRITLLPLFLGAGRHVREDLPRQVQVLAASYPHVQLHLCPPVGEDERLIALLAHMAQEQD